MTADIQDADHVARCCTKRKQEDDGRPAPGAFELKDDDKGCLSVNWLEYFGEKTVADNIPHARKELSMHYKTKKSYRLAVLNVGVAKRAVKGCCCMRG